METKGEEEVAQGLEDERKTQREEEGSRHESGDERWK